MAYLHSKNILHGDLTPKNVLLAATPEPHCEAFGRAAAKQFLCKISDFGLARELGSRGSPLHTETYGTATHVAPELLSDGQLSRAGDVFAFGVCMWEIATGMRPYAGRTAVQVIAQRLMGRDDLPFPPATPPAYAALAQRCIAHSPDDRPSFEDALAELRRMQGDEEAGRLHSGSGGGEGVGGGGAEPGASAGVAGGAPYEEQQQPERQLLRGASVVMGEAAAGSGAEPSHGGDREEKAIDVDASAPGPGSSGDGAGGGGIGGISPTALRWPRPGTPSKRVRLTGGGAAERAAHRVSRDLWHAKGGASTGAGGSGSGSGSEGEGGGGGEGGKGGGAGSGAGGGAFQ